MKEIRFAWVCRNIHFNAIERIELTDTLLLSGSYPSWITSPNCEILAKILPTGQWDKNGKQLWEGDTIIWQDWEQELTEKPDVGVIKYEPPSFIWQWYRKGEALRQDGFENEIHNTDQYEIIGDIWQNPELLAKA